MNSPRWHLPEGTPSLTILLDEIEQNNAICLWQADQLFAAAEG